MRTVRLMSVIVLGLALLLTSVIWYGPTLAGPALAVVQQGDIPMVTLTADGAIRAWPDDNAEFLGSIPFRSSVPTTARTVDSQWWQIPYATGPNGNAWLAATVVMPNAAAANVPVVQIIFATATPAPATPTPLPPQCMYDAAYVADVTIPDRTPVGMGQPFNKTWRVRNAGSCPWDAGTTLAFVGGFQMAAPGSVVVPQTAPGGVVDIGVPMVAPTSPGEYSGVWQMRDPMGQLFGRRITVVINVPNPNPPPPPPGPSIQFWADSTNIQGGQCTNLHWNVNNVRAVYMNGGGVAGQGSQTVCPPNSQTFQLKVTLQDGSQQTREVRINVNNPQPKPGVRIDFSADSTKVTIGSCTRVRWHVENASKVEFHNGSSWSRVGNDGNEKVCLSYPTDYRLRVVDLSGNTHDRSVKINTKTPPLLPTPEPMPGPIFE